MLAHIKLIAIILFVPIGLSFIVRPMPTDVLELSFYSEAVQIEYNAEIVAPSLSILEEQSIVRFYEALEDLTYEPLINSLRKCKNRLGLNDWLLYELTSVAVEEIFVNKSVKEKSLATWFLLSKLGYDTRLAFLKNEALIYVRTLEDIYETPLIEDKGLKFVGLTEMQYKGTQNNKAVYLLNFLAAPDGKPFTFSLDELPKLKPQNQQKKFRFVWQENSYQIDIKCDKTLVEVMKKYPVIGETDYVELSLIHI